MVVVDLSTDFGLLSFEIFDCACGVGRLFFDAVRSGQLVGMKFDVMVPGVVLCGGRSSEVWRECFGVTSDCVDRKAAALRHVGAGLLSCRVGRCGTVMDDICITLSPQPKMDCMFAVLGRLCEGMSVLKSISNLDVDENSRLYTPVKILSAFASQVSTPDVCQEIQVPICSPFIRRSFKSVVEEII